MPTEAFVTPIALAYSVRARAYNALKRIREERKTIATPKAVVDAYELAYAKACEWVESLSLTEPDEEPAPVKATPPTKRTKASPEQDAMKLEIARLKRENAQIKAVDTSVANAKAPAIQVHDARA